MRLTYYKNDLIGSDPEFFCQKEGKIISACKVLPYSKDDICTPFADGFQGEYRTDSYNCREELANQLRFLMRDRIEGKNIWPIFTASIDVTEEMLKGCKARTFQFGCEPDICSYEQAFNINTINYRKWMQREAGGHMHFMLHRIEKKPEKLFYLVKLLDLFVGLSSVIIARKEHKQERNRRRISGQAGAFRLKQRKTWEGAPCSVLEYRTPSCYWVNSIEYCSFLFGIGKLIVGTFWMNSEKTIKKALTWNEQKVREIINESDHDAARKILEPIFEETLASRNQYGRPPFFGPTGIEAARKLLFGKKFETIEQLMSRIGADTLFSKMDFNTYNNRFSGFVCAFDAKEEYASKQ
jgi:hypothetical protein